jgi:hypothetical protein
MCLKYISFNNSFTIPDSTDNNYFKIEKVEWRQAGGPYALHPWDDMTIIAYFNRKVDPVAGRRVENYSMTLGERKAKITRIRVDGTNVYITVRDDKFTRKEQLSFQLRTGSLKDINGNILNRRKGLEFRQFRELFVQEYNKPMEFQNNCFIQPMPLDQNFISISGSSGGYWMNTPLKAEEKKQDSQNH